MAFDLAWSFWCRISLLIALCLLQANPVIGQNPAIADRYNVEAAFLRNFAHYVNWPESAFADSHSPWRICILGSDPLGDVLKKTLVSRSEQGRSFEIYSGGSLRQLPDCQIVFVAYSEPVRRRAALAALQGKPVLTVGDTPEFLQEGGIIQLEVGDRVKMSVNLDQARRVSLTVQTKMLEVSSEVVENGAVKRAR